MSSSGESPGKNLRSWAATGLLEEEGCNGVLLNTIAPRAREATGIFGAPFADTPNEEDVICLGAFGGSSLSAPVHAGDGSDCGGPFQLFGPAGGGRMPEGPAGVKGLIGRT
jgi:hypothetical protein